MYVLNRDLKKKKENKTREIDKNAPEIHSHVVLLFW